MQYDWLEHGWTTHDGGAADLLTDPFLRAYKHNPRFIAFAQKIGVMPKAVPSPERRTAQLNKTANAR